jgi:PKHD-type hydroxylase
MSIVLLHGVLTGEDLARVRAGLTEAPFVDGGRTAGRMARRVKANAQADPRDPRVQALGAFVQAALERHAGFAAAAAPHRLSPVLFSRYAPGMAYGPHVDNVIAQTAQGPLRRDLSFTLFLAEPDAYDGGALRAELGGLTPEFRLAAGDAVLYPSTTIHEVTPVTRGERLAAVGWVQSRVRLGEHRAILADLAAAQQALMARAAPEALLVSKSLANLTRLWSES